MARLEALAAWTESLRDTIAGAVGLEQAIPSSLRVAAPSLQEPLARLVDRLHTRVPMPEALRALADDLDDPSADLIIGALIINARLRGPGLRDLLGALSTAVREELDVRRKVNAERRLTLAQRPDRGARLGRPGAGTGRLNLGLRAGLRQPLGPAAARPSSWPWNAWPAWPCGCAGWPRSTRRSVAGRAVAGLARRARRR